ncbi:MAG: hypothetical protein JWQ86_2935 [Mycobacterium sp.]|nr:hypothetical protein [Mycobacterium sp.]MDT5214840.1 hypothetical protein [Mycobacterium sp.]
MTDGEECNDRVASGDVMVMRKAKSKIGSAFAVAALVASAGVAVSQGTSAADPAAGHKVVYTLTTGAGADFDLYYLTTQPANKAAYNADSYSYLKKESVTLAPGAPWVFETTLADPQWAILTVSSTTHGGREAPNPHCDITVDGQVAVQQDAPYNLQCQLGQW